MKFENDLYQKIYSDYKLEKANDESKKDLVKRIGEFGKKVVINYNPLIGMLPVKKQKDLRSKYKKTFGSLDTKMTTLASAIGMGLGAYLIGMNLDGFDMGFEMMEKFRISWSELGERPIYISFPLIWGGFSKTVTDIASYYLITTSAVRTAACLAGKPIGDLALESISYITRKFSKSSKMMKDRENELLREEKQITDAKSFTENERKKSEDQIAELSKKIWAAKQEKDSDKEQSLKLELESLLN